MSIYINIHTHIHTHIKAPNLTGLAFNVPLERPPGNAAVYISSHRCKKKLISCAGHPLLHSQDWKSWKPGERTADQLTTGSTAYWECRRSGNQACEHTEQVPDSPHHRHDENMSPGGEKCSPGLLWQTEPHRHTMPGKAAPFQPLCSAPKAYAPLHPPKLKTQLPSCPTPKWTNWGRRKFSKSSMASWPWASNCQNLDSDQSIGLQTLHTLRYYITVRKGTGGQGRGKDTMQIGQILEKKKKK